MKEDDTERRNKMMDEARQKNKELDAFLQTTDTLPDDTWYAICDAITYDAATPVNWACRKLKIIYLRTENGESIALPAKNIVLNKENFKTFIIEFFSDFIFKQILKYDL